METIRVDTGIRREHCVQLVQLFRLTDVKELMQNDLHCYSAEFTPAFACLDIILKSISFQVF